MAAIDPTAAPENEADTTGDKKQPRSTLKLVRVPARLLDEDSEDDEDYDDMINGDDEDEEEHRQ